MIDRALLEILVCPSCKGTLTYDDQNNSLTCGQCRLRYPIRDGIPVMLVEEAEKL